MPIYSQVLEFGIGSGVPPAGSYTYDYFNTFAIISDSATIVDSLPGVTVTAPPSVYGTMNEAGILTSRTSSIELIINDPGDVLASSVGLEVGTNYRIPDTMYDLQYNGVLTLYTTTTTTTTTHAPTTTPVPTTTVAPTTTTTTTHAPTTTTLAPTTTTTATPTTTTPAPTTTLTPTTTPSGTTTTPVPTTTPSPSTTPGLRPPFSLPNNYKYGGVPLGYEVGQRTSTYSADWINQDVATLLARDILKGTQIRQRDSLARNILGFPSIPIWSAGCSRSFRRNQAEALPFPDYSFLHLLRNWLFGLPHVYLIYGMRFSTDAAFSLGTGPGIPNPRQAYILNTTAPTQPLYMGDGSLIRPCQTLWDFLTCADPAYLPVQNTGLIFRNLEAKSIETATFQPQVQGLLRKVSTGLPDEPVVVIWNNTRSLDQTSYIPGAYTVSPTAPSLDLSGGSLTPPAGTSGFLYPEEVNAGYPAPYLPVANTLDESWSTINTPFNLSEYTPSNGNDYYIVPTLPENSYEVFIGGTTILFGSAVSIPLQNNWDDNVGPLFRVLRREGESNFIYSGRIQRLWMASMIAQAREDIPGGRITSERTLAAAFCRFLITPYWDGTDSGTPPNGTTTITALDIPDEYENVYLRTDQNTIVSIDGSRTNFQLAQELSGFTNLKISSGNTLLIPGRDWVISKEHPDQLYLSAPISTGTVLEVLAQNRQFLRVQTPLDDTGQESPTHIGEETHTAYNRYLLESTTLFQAVTRRATQEEFPIEIQGEPNRVSSQKSWKGPLAITYGPLVQSTKGIMNRLLLNPGGSTTTPLGEKIATEFQPSTWESLPISAGSTVFGVPFDLETA